MSSTDTTDNQEVVFRVFYEQMQKRVEDLKSTILKTKMKGKDISVDLCIDDIRQCDFDVNSKRIIVNETFYDQPSMFQIAFSIDIGAKNYQDALEAYGYAARFFKDDRAISLSGINWHNNPLDTAYFMPVVGEAKHNFASNIEKKPVYKLYYEIRLGLNSRNSSSFVRTKEPPTVRGKVLK